MSSNDIKCLSRRELYSLVNRLKSEINCLKTDLLRFKLLSIRYQKYLDFLEEINKTNVDLNNELRKGINDLNVINDKNGFVSLNVLKLNLSELESQMNCNKSKKEINECNNGLNGEVVKAVIESEDFECDINCRNDSSDESIDGNVDKISEENSNQFIGNQSEIFDTKEDISETIESNKRQINEQKSKSNVKRNKSKVINKRKQNLLNKKSNNNCLNVSNKSHKMLEIESEFSTDFVCDFIGCDFRSIYKNCLEEHKSFVHSINKRNIGQNISEKFFCDWIGCEKSFDKKRYLSAHKARHEKLSSNSTESQYNSNKDIHSIDSELKHLGIEVKHKISSVKSKRVRVFDKKFVCDWDGCGKVFNKKSNLKTHKDIHLGNSNNNSYSCAICAATFITQTYLNRHMIRHEGRYLCDSEGCAYSARDHNELSKHKAKHSMIRRFECGLDGCEKQYNYESILKEHKLKAHPNHFIDIEWTNCTENGCNFKTKSKTAFTKHCEIHNKQFVCNICDKCFARNEYLKKHILVHLGNTDAIRKRVQCEWYGCDQWFAKPTEMKDHMNIHLGQTPYSCLWPSCDKQYSTKKSLATHTQRHTQLSYRCDWNKCEYQTTNPIRLKEHKNKHKSLE